MGLKLVTDYATMKNPFDQYNPGLHARLQSKALYQQGVSFDQIGTAPVRGVCFRVSYKWLVSTWKGGEFKAESMNMDKAYGKQMDYLKQADTMVGQQYDTWFKNANILSQKTLQTWGAKHGHSCDTPCTTDNLSSAAPLQQNANMANPDTAMIVGFFGKKTDGSVWGHATAYCSRNGNSRFFDINYGVYEFEAGDDRGATMQDWIKKNYVNSTKAIEDYVLYRIY